MFYIAKSNTEQTVYQFFYCKYASRAKSKDVTEHALSRRAQRGGQTIRYSLDDTFFTRFFLSRSNFTRHRSTMWPNDSIFHSIFCREKNQVKNRIVQPRLKTIMLFAPQIHYSCFKPHCHTEPAYWSVLILSKSSGQGYCLLPRKTFNYCSQTIRDQLVLAHLVLKLQYSTRRA